MIDPTHPAHETLMRVAAKDPRYAKYVAGGRSPALRPPCASLGARLKGEPCGSTLRLCTLHGDACTRFAPCKGAARCCAGCPDYATARAADGGAR